MSIKFDSIEDIIEDVRQGKMVIMTDDESRENEGDLIFAAECVTPEKVNFMAQYGKGLICVPMAEERSMALGLRDMVDGNSDDVYRTAFTLSVDAKIGVTTGISAYDRAHTIEVLADLKRDYRDIVSPGHVFPLKAKNGGVLTRAGHTEAGVDLSRLAGFSPTSVICEIMDSDGTMMRTPELMNFAKEHQLKIGTIKSLIEYRRKFDRLVNQVAESEFSTQNGKWQLKVFRSLVDGNDHVAMIKGEVTDDPILVRVHAECFVKDVLGSLKPGHKDLLHPAVHMIEKEERGVLLYLRPEGRDLSLANKVKSYDLQNQGLDAEEANQKLGINSDLREYGMGAEILRNLGVKKIKLVTNNPRKIIGLEGHGLEVVERVSLLDQESRTENLL